MGLQVIKNTCILYIRVYSNVYIIVSKRVYGKTTHIIILHYNNVFYDIVLTDNTGLFVEDHNPDPTLHLKHTSEDDESDNEDEDTNSEKEESSCFNQ